MNVSKLFYEQNYKVQKLLKKGVEGRTDLVAGPDRLPYVRKIINYELPVFIDLMKTEHAGLPKIYYASIIEGKTYVIEEYLSGVTLQEYIDKQRNFSEKEITLILKQLCDILAFLHKLGIIHRDINPSNIMLLNNSLYLKLLDFGSARKLNQKSKDTYILGTPGYAPPEQFGFSATDERSDIYALGKTLEQLLPVDYNGRLCYVFSKCTELDPKHRVASITELNKILEDKNKNWVLRFSPILIVILSLGLLSYAIIGNRNEASVAVGSSDKKIAQKEEVRTSKEAAVKENHKEAAQKPQTAINSESSTKNTGKTDVQKRLQEKFAKIQTPQMIFARTNQKLIKTTNLYTGEIRYTQPVPEWDISFEAINFNFWIPNEERIGNMRTKAVVHVYNNGDIPFERPRIKIKFKGLLYRFTDNRKGKFVYPRADDPNREVLTGLVFEPGTYKAKEIEIQYYGTIRPHERYEFGALFGKAVFETTDWKGDNPPEAEISLYNRDNTQIAVTSIVKIGMDDYRYPR